jgi:hypothetical protein
MAAPWAKAAEAEKVRRRAAARTAIRFFNEFLLGVVRVADFLLRV